MEWEVYFSRYKNMILSAAIIIFALIISWNIYKVQNKLVVSLKAEKAKEMKKNTILGNINQLDKRLTSYKNFLNKKDISLVIDNIGNIAKDANVKIASIKPEPEQVFPLYIKFTFSLKINVNDYLSLGNFISKLENSYDVYMIENLSVIPAREGSEETSIKNLSVFLKMSTFLFKD